MFGKLNTLPIKAMQKAVKISKLISNYMAFRILGGTNRVLFYWIRFFKRITKALNGNSSNSYKLLTILDMNLPLSLFSILITKQHVL